MNNNTANFASFVPSYLPPFNGEAELSVLRALMLNPDAYEFIKTKDLPPEAFFIPAHRNIYQAICALKERSCPADLMHVQSYLLDHKIYESVGGNDKLVEILSGMDPSIKLDRYVDLLIDKLIRRQLIKSLNDQLEQVYTSNISTDALLTFVKEEMDKATHSRHLYKSEREYLIEQGRKLIDAVRNVELTVDRPDDRAYLLQMLANKHDGWNAKGLKDLYYKSLVAEENEPIMTIEEAMERFGDDVNEWLLHGFLPKGKTVLLHAHPNVGKTFLAYKFIYHLVTGLNWEGFPVSASSRKCLIVQADETGSDMLKKLADIGIEKGMPIGIKTKWTVDHIQQLRKEIIEGGYEVVLIDSLTAVSRHSCISENDTEYARPILLLRDIAQETGATIILTHHSNSDDKSRGTKAITAAVSEVLHLKRPDNQNDLSAPERTLLIEKSRSSSVGRRYALQFNYEDNQLRCLGKEGEEPMTMKTKDKIVNFLSENAGKMFETIEIQDHISGSWNHVRTTVAELANEGVINRKKKDSDKRAYLYYLEYCDLRSQVYNKDHVKDHVCKPQRDGVLENRDPGSEKNGFHDNGEGKKKPENGRSHDHVTPEAKQDKEEANDPLSDLSHSSPSFFGDLKNVGSVNLLNRNDNGSHAGTNYNNNFADNHSLAKFKKGDRVVYVGDHPALKNKELVISQIHPESLLDFYYSCTDPAKPKGFTPRIKEDDLKSV